MKICVYAIAKNEMKFVERFMTSCKEADGVYVLDTGSTDGTAKRLAELGAVVKTEEIKPWRFDTARNKSLDMLPEDADICVSLDLDEVLSPGWRNKLTTAWKFGTTRAHYKYVWNFNPDGSEGIVFNSEKIHTRHGFKWVFPVHEILRYTKGEEKHIIVPNMRIDHHADDTKPRSSYLPLLEQAVEENPENDRMTHYLGREYMFYRQYKNAIKTLKRHLSLPSATWKAERAASMRFISRCEAALGNPNMAELWLYRAIGEAPKYREPYTDMAALMYERGDWRRVVYFCDKALSITSRERTYITEPRAWGSYLWDILSIAWDKLNKREYALNCAKQALKIEPGNERIQKNILLMQS